MSIFKKFKKLPTWVLWPVYALSKLLAATYRISVRDPGNSQEYILHSPAIFAIWHNRILCIEHRLTPAFRHKLSALISKSRDGEYIAALIRLFGINVVRGSSSRGGAMALKELVNEVNAGQSPIITVDGPRGPKYSVHPGAAILATKCNVPVICATMNSQSYWQFKSWDGMQLPKPFSKIEIVFTPPEPLTTTTLDEQCEEIRQRLMSITKD